MQAGPNDLPPYDWVFILALAVTFWCFISFVIGIQSGWFSLSRRFRAQAEPCGETRSAGPFFYTVYMRFWLHYSSVIRMTAAARRPLSICASFHSASATLRYVFHGRRSRSAERSSSGCDSWSSPLAVKSASPCASPSAWRASWASANPKWVLPIDAAGAVRAGMFLKTPRCFRCELLANRSRQKPRNHPTRSGGTLGARWRN